MAKLEQVEGKNAREYLQQVNKRIADIEKRFEKTINSRKIINLTLSNRIEALEKKGKQ
ncbi:hypothetical protein ES703_17975 [subsurface metagenome]